MHNILGHKCMVVKHSLKHFRSNVISDNMSMNCMVEQVVGLMPFQPDVLVKPFHNMVD
jgi:hypothetical protein